ncbi:hypothetical protein HC928_25700 [bacterium]|nr:hypothetical protein [bacterium]
MNTDGTRPRQLTDEAFQFIVHIDSFAWSPDGQHIAFTQYLKADTRASHTTLQWINVETQEVTVIDVAAQPRIDLPSWSPNGQLLAIADGSGIWIIDREQGTDLKVADGLYGFAAWSPDGASIAFLEQCRGGGIEILVMEFATKNIEPLTRGECSASALPLTWSPDSRYLAYNGPPIADKFDIKIIDLQKNLITTVTDPLGGQHTFPTWANDSQHLAFISVSSRQYEVWLADIITGELTNLSALYTDEE